MQRLLKLKKNPTLPGLEESSRDAADLLRERDEELADLSTKNVDPAVTAYVEEDRKLFARGMELAERYQQYFEKYLKGGLVFPVNPGKGYFRNMDGESFRSRLCPPVQCKGRCQTGGDSALMQMVRTRFLTAG